ncbi:hypothetical protein WSM22_14850 [Cytophagales bacterium WSM2-2]|nr:hypothetical protein WSM22_14850 [Cytophagales bacterium WSM2-2]
MILRFKIQSALIFPLLFLPLLLFAQKPVPELWGQRIHDEAHALQQGTIEQLEKDLKAHEDSTSNQIAVLLVQSLDGDVLEEYSIRVVEKWKLGQKGKDNGVLLLVAIDDHKMRIEVGRGLQGSLTDAVSSRIIRNELAPAFRRGDYDAGIIAGVNAIVKTIAGEYGSDGSDDSNAQNLSEGIEFTTSERILFGCFIFGILGLFTVFAILVRGIGWGLYAFLIPFYAVFPWIVVGTRIGVIVLIVYAVVVPILKLLIEKTPAGKSFKGGLGKTFQRSSSSSSSGSSWSSSSDSDSSWSSSSSDSFSGGGGSFDGGGSSGSW